MRQSSHKDQRILTRIRTTMLQSTVSRVDYTKMTTNKSMFSFNITQQHKKKVRESHIN